MRGMLKEQFQHDEAYAPARVLNLVVVVDREWRGEILNRLEQVGRYGASRTIVCAVEEGRTTIDAWASITPTTEHHKPGELALTRERIVLDLGPKHLTKLDTIVDPLVVPDIPTLMWSPHGHPEAVDALLGLSQVVLIDSVGEPDPAVGARPRPRTRAAGLRRRSRLAAQHALARARRDDLRPAPVAPGARPHRQGRGQASSRLGRRRCPLLRLARIAARLGARRARARERHAARQGARQADRRDRWR